MMALLPANFGVAEDPQTKRMRELAASLTAGGTTAPKLAPGVQYGWGQGLSQIAQALSGAYVGRQADDRVQQQSSAAQQALAQAMTTGDMAPLAAIPQLAPYALQAQMKQAELKAKTAAEIQQKKDEWDLRVANEPRLKEANYGVDMRYEPQLAGAKAGAAASAQQPFDVAKIQAQMAANVAQAGPVAAAQANARLPAELAVVGAKAGADKASGKTENQLRDEYNSLSKDFRTVQDAHTKIQTAGESKTGAGDMSLLYSYVKLLDPGSVVRESEFATAAASGSFGERIQGAAQRIATGERLPDSLRNDFLREANNLYGAQRRGYENVRTQYKGIAERVGVNPENVIVDYAAGGSPIKQPSGGMPAPKTREEATALPSGTRYTAPDGSVRVKP